jgi:hypothetical protein
MKQTVESPTTGVLESVSKVSGQALFREAPLPVEVKAYLAGTVSAVTRPSAARSRRAARSCRASSASARDERADRRAQRGRGAPAHARRHQARARRRGAGRRLAGEPDVLHRAIEVKAAALVTGGLDAGRSQAAARLRPGRRHHRQRGDRA